MTLLTPPSKGSFNSFLATLPPVAFTTFFGVLLALATAAVVLACFARGVVIPVEGLIAWLAFVAAMLHVSYQSFKVKRQTFRPDLVPVGSAEARAELRDVGGDTSGNVERESSFGASSGAAAEGMSPRMSPLMMSEGGSIHVLPADQVPDFLRALPGYGSSAARSRRRADDPPVGITPPPPAGSYDPGA